MEDSGHKQSSGENQSCDCQRYSLTDWDCVRRRCRDKEEQKRFSKLLLNKHCGLSLPTSLCVLTSCNRSKVKYLFWRPAARNVWPNNFIVAGWFTINLTSFHPKLSLLKSTRPLVKGTTPQYFEDGQKTAVNLSLFLSATFSRWKHLLSTFTVNDRSITRSSFEINVLIPRLDAVTSDAVIDRRISVAQSLANQRTVLGLVDQWEATCHGLVTCCDGSDHWHVVCHALRVDKSSMWRHLQTSHLSFFFFQRFLCVFMISSSYKLTHCPQCSARAAHIVNILGRSISTISLREDTELDKTIKWFSGL